MGQGNVSDYAWCDEPIMKSWINEIWGNVFLSTPTPGSSGKILYADVHSAQQTDDVKLMIQQRVKTALVNVLKVESPWPRPISVKINKLT